MKNLIILVSIVFSGGPAIAQTSYRVDDAISQMQDALRNVLMPEVTPEIWLSLTTIGAVAEKDDPAAINELANFCPQPSRTITAFGGIRPLDQVYETAILGMTGPSVNVSQQVEEARATINDEIKIRKYDEYKEKSVETLKKIILEEDESKLPALYVDYENIEQNWKIRGYKDEIEAALFIIDASAGLFSESRNFHRLRILSTYKSNGLTKNWAIGSFNSPLSAVSPPVSTWENPSGWVSISFDNSTYNNRSSSSSSSSSGGGFLHIGGLIGGGSGGGGSSTSTSTSEVKNYKYSFSVKRVRVIRDWLDYRVFGTVGGWTWKEEPDMEKFPLISAGITTDNQPLQPEYSIYASNIVECPMIPVEMIIAKDINIEVTTSRSFYNATRSAGSSSSGGMFGGIIGGNRSNSWSTMEITSNGDDVTFSVKAPGTAVIGLISQLVGKVPAPNPSYDWPDNAWLEGE